MLVVRRLSTGVRGSCWCGQGQQKGARRLSSSTLDSSKKVDSGKGYWPKAQDAAAVVLGVIAFGTVIVHVTLRVEDVRAEVAKRQTEWEKRDLELRAELTSQIDNLRGYVKERDAIRGGEVDRRILDLLTRGDYDRARVLLEERANARLAGLSPSPPPPPPSST